MIHVPPEESTATCRKCCKVCSFLLFFVYVLVPAACVVFFIVRHIITSPAMTTLTTLFHMICTANHPLPPPPFSLILLVACTQFISGSSAHSAFSAFAPVLPSLCFWTPGGCGHVGHLLRRPRQGESTARLPLVYPHRCHQGRQKVSRHFHFTEPSYLKTLFMVSSILYKPFLVKLK